MRLATVVLRPEITVAKYGEGARKLRQALDKACSAATTHLLLEARSPERDLQREFWVLLINLLYGWYDQSPFELKLGIVLPETPEVLSLVYSGGTNGVCLFLKPERAADEDNWNSLSKPWPEPKRCPHCGQEMP